MGAGDGGQRPPWLWGPVKAHTYETLSVWSSLKTENNNPN